MADYLRLSREALNDLLAKIQGFPEEVQVIVWDRVMSKYGLLIEAMARCDSPIEQMLLLPLEEVCDRLLNRPDCTIAVVIEQCAITVGNKNYRVDFRLALDLVDHTCKDFIIECDGHDFHEKTKEQAAADKQRERDFQSIGYTVIRFTGSEIYNNPYKCAEEVYRIVKNQLDQISGE